ncbi:MAG: hypothetical protein ACOCTS_01520 [Thermodesulfobacteriota bacterium]
MPFTYASLSMIERLHQWAGPFTMLAPVSGRLPEPVRQAAADGRIDVRAPVAADDEQITASVEKFKIWGAAHEGHMDAFKTMAEHYDSEAFTAELRTDILRGRARADAADPMFNARLFLALAQEYDMQQAELQTELQAAEASRRQMLAALKGDAQTRAHGAASGAPSDPGHYLTDRRICSWLRLLTAESDFSRIWLTSSPAVFDYMLEFLPGAEQAAHFCLLPKTETSAAELNSYLSALADGRFPDAPASVSDQGAESGQGECDPAAAVLPFSSPAALLAHLLSDHEPVHALQAEALEISGSSVSEGGGRIVLAFLGEGG